MKHNYRIFTILILIILIISACGNDKDEKEEEKTYSVGILNVTPFLEPTVNGFKDGMAELGYAEGENITYIYEGPTVLTTEELIEADVDLLFSTTGYDAGNAP